MTRLFKLLADLFPLWVLTCSGLALFFPHWFTWFNGQMIVWGLTIIMAGADVAQSVLMTMCSTFAAFALTSLLTQWLAAGWRLHPTHKEPT